MNSQGDLISRDALNETIDEITWYHINQCGELVEGARGDSDALFKAEDIFNAIDNALTVESITIFCENADKKTIEELKSEMRKAKLAVFDERTQGKCEKCDYYNFSQAFINGIVEVISKYGITTVDELLKLLKGGAE